MKEVAFILTSPPNCRHHKYTMDRLKLKNSAELIQFALKSSIMSA